VVLSNKELDLAAGILIAREAGTVVMDSSGVQHTRASVHTIAAAPGVAEQLLSLVQSVV
jgi:myo-inositol-1(or 4)-monophosphatase